jgi:hypothetical protein
MKQTACPTHVAHHRQAKKSKWTQQEDDQLQAAVQAFGTNSWNTVASHVPSRTGKQCRERWIGQLSPLVSKDVWMPEEDAILLQHHAQIGNHWTSIALQLPGRTALQVKNRWNWLVRHRPPRPFSRMGPRPGSMAVVMERKPSQIILEPIAFDDGLFGTAFQQFQARMLMG